MSPDLEAELHVAERWTADHLGVSLALEPLALPWHRLSIGLDFVRLEAGGLYEPAPDGAPALIVAAERIDGELLDLVAVRLSDRATATRLGEAVLLGERALALHHRDKLPLRLCRDVPHWLHLWAHGLVLLDWSRGLPRLAGVRAFRAAARDRELADRLAGGLELLGCRPSIVLAEASSGACQTLARNLA